LIVDVARLEFDGERFVLDDLRLLRSSISIRVR
jgi:hypothetical protein